MPRQAGSGRPCPRRHTVPNRIRSKPGSPSFTAATSAATSRTSSMPQRPVISRNLHTRSRPRAPSGMLSLERTSRPASLNSGKKMLQTRTMIPRMTCPLPRSSEMPPRMLVSWRCPKRSSATTGSRIPQGIEQQGRQGEGRGPLSDHRYSMLGHVESLGHGYSFQVIPILEASVSRRSAGSHTLP